MFELIRSSNVSRIEYPCIKMRDNTGESFSIEFHFHKKPRLETVAPSVHFRGDTNTALLLVSFQDVA